ncbi:MAG: ACP S-malonyltransferase [Candidatus Omnitrophica bacterium]|nr:ACP S-malonyltransferase [Candidatus Omnitrophota bacterium]
MKISVVFPGQASQYVGMGKEIIEENSKYREILEIGEKITGLPIIEKIYNGPIEELTRTLYCQPSVFGISLVCWKYFKDKTEITPFCLAGHSLGEYTGLCVGSVFSIEEGFYLVKRRAQIMDEVSQKVDGSLLAILGISLRDVEEIIRNFNEVEVSNINSYTQIIVGGPKSELEKLEKYLKGKRIKSIFLKVSGPFHTKYMKQASEEMKKEIEKINFKNSEVPIYLNYSAKKTVDKEEIKDGLLKQFYSSVRWIEIIENMVKDGVDCFVEIGPKNVLKKLIESIFPDIPSFNIENQKTFKEFYSFFKGGRNV